MTREDFAKAIHWKGIIRVISTVNPLLMTPQLWELWSTFETAGISIWMLLFLFFIQFGFAGHGFFIRDRHIMWSNFLAATMTVVTILSVLYLR